MQWTRLISASVASALIKVKRHSIDKHTKLNYPNSIWLRFILVQSSFLFLRVSALEMSECLSLNVFKLKPHKSLTVESSAESVWLLQVQNARKLFGPMAQWIRHLTTNQGIAGSSPARVKCFFYKTIIKDLAGTISTNITLTIFSVLFWERNNICVKCLTSSSPIYMAAIL